MFHVMDIFIWNTQKKESVKNVAQSSKMYDDEKPGCFQHNRPRSCCSCHSNRKHLLNMLSRVEFLSEAPHLFCLGSNNQPCVTDQDRDKNNRPLILDSGESSVRTGRPGRQRVPTDTTSSHNEMPSWTPCRLIPTPLSPLSLLSTLFAVKSTITSPQDGVWLHLSRNCT